MAKGLVCPLKEKFSRCPLSRGGDVKNGQNLAYPVDGRVNVHVAIYRSRRYWVVIFRIIKYPR